MTTTHRRRVLANIVARLRADGVYTGTMSGNGISLKRVPAGRGEAIIWRWWPRRRRAHAITGTAPNITEALAICEGLSQHRKEQAA